MPTPDSQDTSRARVFVRNPDGLVLVHHFHDPRLAYSFYLGLNRKTKAAFRSAGDRSKVESWDFVTGG